LQDQQQMPEMKAKICPAPNSARSLASACLAVDSPQPGSDHRTAA
jgi:hypothetical protein